MSNTEPRDPFEFESKDEIRGRVFDDFGSRRRPTSPTSQIVDQLSTESRETVFSRIADVTSRISSRAARATMRQGDANRTFGRVRDLAGDIGYYNRSVDAALRANPYGGQAPLSRPGTPGGGGFDGYYDEAEFEDPLLGNRFYPGDARTILGAMSPEVVTRLQERLEGLGFLTGSWVPGAVTAATERAFADLLQESNRRGTSWGVTLGDLEQLSEELGMQVGGGDDRAPFVAPTYVAPDYATLAEKVKSQMRQHLGRDPDESEMALFTAELSGWDREAFDLDVAAQRADYEAENAAIESGEDQAGGTLQGVDPLARFKESFESKFAGELQGIERVEEAGEASESVRGAVSNLSRMSGGMG